MPYVTEANLTDVALERWKDIPDPRLRQVMQSLIKHLHAFVREARLTEREFQRRSATSTPSASAPLRATTRPCSSPARSASRTSCA